MRPTELFPKPLIEELVRLGRLDREWVQWESLPNNAYRAHCRQATPLNRILKSGSDYFGMKAATAWLVDGPKVFKPTPEQSLALEQVSVNLGLSDYAQPFPAVAVAVNYPPFHTVLCYHEPGLLVANLLSKGNTHDIVTTVGTLDGEIEDSLQKFDEDCRADAPVAHKALRVAVNACLALTHFGHHMDYLFPKEVDSDVRLSKESTPRGERARWRLPLAVMRLSFSREVVLHRVERVHREPGEPTGAEKGPHFRRGHWAMLAVGPGRIERRRTFRPGVFVRPDLFIGDVSNTSTEYRA